MKKQQAIAIANKLAPSAITTEASRTIKLIENESQLQYSSDLGFLTAKGLDFNIGDGNYDLHQLTKLFKIMGDDAGKKIKGGVSSRGIKVTLDTLASEVYELPNELTQVEKVYEFETKRFADILTSSREFLVKNNSVSRFIFDSGHIIAFDGVRVFMTTALECEDGSEDNDPGIKAFQGLQFELRTEHLEPLIMFLTAVESGIVTLSTSPKTLVISSESASLVLFTLEIGKVTTIENIRPLFKQGDYYLLDNQELNISQSLKNILALDTNKNPIVYFSKENQAIHNDSQNVCIEFEGSPIKSAFRANGKFLNQCLNVFAENEEVTIEVYSKCLVVKTKFNKRCLLMHVAQ